MPDRLDAESLLALQIVETERMRDEWIEIAEVYRRLSESAVEMIARLEEQNRRLRGLVKNMGDELMLRKAQ